MIIQLPGQLRGLIDKCGLTHKEVAQRAGITDVYLCYIIAGSNKPSLPTLERIADVLGCDVQVSFKPKGK